MKLWVVYEVIDGNFNLKLYAIVDSEKKALEMCRTSVFNLKIGREPFVMNEPNPEKDWAKRHDNDVRPKLNNQEGGNR